MNASSRVVDTQSTNASVNSTSGSVTFKSGTTGTIHLSCPITWSIIQGGAFCSALGMTWRDPDGTGNKAQAVAFLRQMSFHTGGVLTPITVPLGNNTTGGVEYKTFSDFVAYDFTNYYYYVDVQLVRQDATVDAPAFYGVTLDTTGGACLF